GAAVKQAAYDVQRQAWSRTLVNDPQGLLERVKLDSAQLYRADGEHLRRVMRSAAEARSAGADGARLSPVAVRGLALAALAVLGQAGDDQEARIEPMLIDGSGVNCLRMAKLNLFQCMAVAGPQYEDLFCTGEHAMMETARCVVAASDTAADVALASNRPDPGYGSERESVERGYAPMR
ncbi:MAG TPA: hypothetical protein VG939_04005, partial [Caulobacteraceae bacterium]|nr:hypothetical protein [Caulobacteraceae bacterium]